jgi:prevent-host-death family protein
MIQTILSPTDLSERTREILDRVHEGELAVVVSGGEERIVLLDALDYRLLQALAVCATGADTEEPQELPEVQVIRDYLDERINLGKAAELIQVTRFELEDSFRRLRVPLRLGVASAEDAQAEMTAARRRL